MKLLRFGAENGFDIFDAINSRFPVFERVDRRRKGLPKQRKDAQIVVVKRCNIRRVRFLLLILNGRRRRPAKRDR